MTAAGRVRGAPLGTGRLAVIQLHGRGQEPDWIHAHVADPLAAALPDLPVTFSAPAAPGGSWYARREHDPLAETLAGRERAADVVDALADDAAAAGHGPATIGLRAHGAAVELVVRPGRGHEVDATEIAAAAALLRRVAP